MRQEAGKIGQERQGACKQVCKAMCAGVPIPHAWCVTGQSSLRSRCPPSRQRRQECEQCSVSTEKEREKAQMYRCVCVQAIPNLQGR